MINAVKEILDAIQSEATFDNSEVEKEVINALEVLNKDLLYVQFEASSDTELAVTRMNKAIASANAEIEVDEDDEDDDEEEELLELDEEDEDDEDELLDLTPETEDDTDEPATPTQ